MPGSVDATPRNAQSALFRRAVRDLQTAEACVRSTRVSGYAAARAAVLEAACLRNPRRAVPEWLRDPEDTPEMALGEVVLWAGRTHKGLEAHKAEELAQVAAAPYLVANREADRAREEAKRQIAELAPTAVFAPEPEARNIVYRLYGGTFRSQGHGEERYSRQHCRLVVGILLEVRGFTWKTEERGGEYLVITNAPEEIKYALPHWTIDDARLYAAAGANNLKVVFGSSYPVVGAWEVPVGSRQTRDCPSYAEMRENEDKHLALSHS